MRGGARRRTGYAVAFHLTDRCQLQCKDCHWFSAPVREVPDLPESEWIAWLRRHVDEISRLRLTGGEPTLFRRWDAIALEAMGLGMDLEICTNGVAIEEVETWAKSCVAFRTPGRCLVTVNITPPRETTQGIRWRWAGIGMLVGRVAIRSIDPDANQLTMADASLVGKHVQCRPSTVRFAADGRAYQCEEGLRSKRDDLATGHTLWSRATPVLAHRECIVGDSCPSAFAGHEQIIGRIR
jgi:hypothetical protein